MITREFRIKHGCARSKECGGRSNEYISWEQMKGRCLNKNHHKYKDYGGKGINIYEPWITSFQRFIDHIGFMANDGVRYVIDRIDNNKGYIPGNVRWVTKADSNRNRNMPHTLSKEKQGMAVFLYESGKKISDIARDIGTTWGTVHRALKRNGINVEKRSEKNNSAVSV